MPEKMRLDELCSRLVDGLLCDDRESAIEYFITECEMTKAELEYFGVELTEEELEEWDYRLEEE